MKCDNSVHHLTRKHFSLVVNGKNQIDCKLKITWTKLIATKM